MAVIIGLYLSVQPGTAPEVAPPITKPEVVPPVIAIEEDMSPYYQSERDITLPTILPDANAYHLSEWGWTPPSTFPRLDTPALAEYHQSEWGHPTTQPLPDAYRQSEWDRTPLPTLRQLDAAALFEYHQSEWSR